MNWENLWKAFMVNFLGSQGCLGVPPPLPAPALLAALGAGCSPVYSATHPRTPVHQQASTLHQWKNLVAPEAWCTCGALVQVHPVQNQKCSWTRFALAVPAPTTQTCTTNQAQPAWRLTTIIMLSEMEVASSEAISGEHSTISQTATTHPRALLWLALILVLLLIIKSSKSRDCGTWLCLELQSGGLFISEPPLSKPKKST